MSDSSRKSLSEEIFRYKSLLEAYEKELTIANYVRLKRQNRGGYYISKFADFDPFSLEEELRRFGISPQLVFDALDREERDNERDIEELALQLLECLVKRDRIEKEGSTHVQSRRIAIPDSLVDFLTVAMIETFHEISDSLIVLIRERLCGRGSNYYQDSLRFKKQRDAVALAAVKFPSGKISIRKIAKLMNVEPSTVSRWFPAGDLQEQVDRFRKMIDAFGLRGKDGLSGTKAR